MREYKDAESEVEKMEYSKYFKEEQEWGKSNNSNYNSDNNKSLQDPQTSAKTEHPLPIF